MIRRSIVAVVLAGSLAVSCSSGSDNTEPTETTLPVASDSSDPVDSTSTSATTDATTTTTSAPITTEPQPPQTTAPAADQSLAVRDLVEALASDSLTGRDNGTDGSLAARRLLIDQLALFTQPAFVDSTGDDRFLQHFDEGANILAVIPGGDLSDEYVLVGAHYDHLGQGNCPTNQPADEICNGATDNATGVAAAIEVARSIVADGSPRRSVVIALWDAEEDGLLGSAHYVANPLVPLAQTIAYVNFDIQGAALLPSLANTTIMVGAETGGEPFIDAAARATNASTLDTVSLSLVFGQGRSDHANLVQGGVPSVFFTDANSACYHTAQDDLDVVNFDKLGQQIATATALTSELVATDSPPVFDPAPPLTTHADAKQLLAVVGRAEPDFDRFDSPQRASTEQFLVDLERIVDAGPNELDEAAIGTLLGGAAALVDTLTQGECDGFVPSD
jgi:hypothetical protein